MGLKYNVIVCMVAFSKHHSHVGVAQMNRIGSLEPEAAAPSNRQETQENPNNGSMLPVCFHPGVWLHCNVNGTFVPETHRKWTIHLFKHFLLFLPLSLTLSVFGSRAQYLAGACQSWQPRCSPCEKVIGDILAQTWC